MNVIKRPLVSEGYRDYEAVDLDDDSNDPIAYSFYSGQGIEIRHFDPIREHAITLTLSIPRARQLRDALTVLLER